MKKTVGLSLAALAIAAGIFNADAKSFKRGVSENQFQYRAQMEALAPGVSWYYNWGNTPSSYLANEDYMEYLPMCWNANYSAERIINYCKEHPEVKYILGYNEPNFKAQSNMTPAAAAQDWHKVQEIAKECGLKIVAPALNYSPDAPYNDPMRWMDEFVAIVGLDAFDYVALHNYGGFGVMKDLCTRFHDKYGKDVWVTEFCYWPEEGNANSSVSPAVQIASMVQSVLWLEQTEWIHRYAWFKAIGNATASKGPNYGLLVPGKGEDPRELTEQGKVYVNLGTFDRSVWQPINTFVPATEFVDQSACQVGVSADPEYSPIEISGFNAGAWAEYQFDVPEAGEYTLTLSVSGMGEPERFNPSLRVSLKEGDEFKSLAEKDNYQLPNANDMYEDITFTFTLPAGHQILRLEDKNPYMPSGIRIHTLRLADASGVELTEAAGGLGEGDGNVYTLQGIKIGTAANLEAIPAGIYIVNGKKVKL